MPRILLVEDNDMNRDMLSRRLVKRGFDVTFALDGREGVDKALTGGFDLILMDISLPEMDGCTATRLIREAPQTAKTPIIALTAHAMAGDRERALEAGCNDYDTKPIELERLLGKMQALLPPSP